MVVLFSHSVPHFVCCGLLTQILQETFDAGNDELVDLRIALRAIFFFLIQTCHKALNCCEGTSILAFSSVQRLTCLSDSNAWIQQQRQSASRPPASAPSKAALLIRM